ncbi:farnesyl diphosphate synthase [Micractinium conductrix]|uniref:Farnesyl diphosphate synthase n=1 Tax=Micractinium conductrix TaxID=554055 RepID=A0A2P6VM23_9CHLO|nr:farnesyl diphosphate synthase [Micractinium conductrix]|eukprot:PSC75133.1 farnesyl diphosphate synthase [Micractinium conductrix]
MAALAEPPLKQQKLDKNADKQEFLKVFEQLRDEIVNDELLAGQPDFAKAWVKEMMDYNVPLGKLNRGMAVLDVLRSVAGGKGTELSEEAVFRAQALGWCIEFLQAYFLVADDIMDSSITRRGQPCWYRQPKVGMVAINDGIILEACIFRILRKHFCSLPSYVHLLDLFHEVTYQTAHGQLLDTTTAPIGTVDLTRYTLDTYLRIVTYKTAYYTFYLPVACGLRLAGVTDPAAYKLAEDICVTMGQYFQIQDDYLDCYGDPVVIGKIGTDIQDNKCSWLVVQALQRASEAQKKVIEDNYGQDDKGKVQAVKAVYRELQLEAVFKQYEQESYNKLVQTIKGQDLLPQAVFTMLLKKIYKRQK